MEGFAVNVAKKLLLSVFICGSLVSAQADGQTNRGMPSPAERIARAKWQPTRSVMVQGAEPLPAPQAVRPQPQVQPMPAPPQVFEHEGPMHFDGPIQYDDHVPLHEGCNCSSCQAAGACDAGCCDGMGCDSQGCDGFGCDASPCDAMGDCGDYCGPLPRLNLFLPLPCHGWIHGEYLNWRLRGMQIPPLVTVSRPGTAQAQAGVLGFDSTTTVLGGEMLDQSYSGARLRAGFWLDRCRNEAIQFEVFGVGEETDTRRFTGNGNNIIARPFFNILNGGAEDAELVAFPGVVNGNVTVEANSSLTGVSASWLWVYARSCTPGMTFIDMQRVGVRRSISFSAGWRYLNLDEDLTITEDLTSQIANDPGNFDITDRFSTRNQFNGADIGVFMNSQRGRWSLDMLMRLAVGATKQEATVFGQTIITNANPGNNGVFDGGLYAQTTNMGDRSRNRFSVVPELGLTLGYQLRPRWRATVGYSFLYWSNVARPGDQIDRVVNPNLLPPPVNPLVGAARPEFRFVDSDLWINGVNVGLEYTW